MHSLTVREIPLGIRLGQLMAIVGIFILILFPHQSTAGEVFTAEDVLRTKSCSNVQISPDGQWIAYTVSVPRGPGEKPGGAYSELYIVSIKTGEIRPFVTGKTSVSSPLWSPDGSMIAFLTRRGDKAKTQVWAIPLKGGEAFQLTGAKNNISSFRWHPGGKQMAYIATTPKTGKEEELEKRGYGFVFFEENLKHRNLYITSTEGQEKNGAPDQLTEGVTVWNFEFSPDGKTIAAAISPNNLVDERYMFQRLHLIDVAAKKVTQLTNNPGKLGNYAFSPDGSRIVYGAARERADHAVSQAYVISVSGGNEKNLTPANFIGHINWVGWKDNKTVVYRAAEGVWPTLSTVGAEGGERQVILHSRETGVIFSNPSHTKDFMHFAMMGNTPEVPGEVYYWQKGRAVKRMTNVNPWISERNLGQQEVVRYSARDGSDIEGLLIYPVGYEPGIKYPLVVIVHGGPESHYSNGWLTSYSRPGQTLAGKGYVVFYPNYRTSTGYGVDRALQGFGDPAGKEFDDIADGIDWLIEEGIADPDRVGLGGGSYGGFAAAWFSSFYTKYVKAVCMFVGISDLISKAGTTDIPYEILYVHFGKTLEERWEMSLKRSPIYWAHQSRTAVLILGGTGDTRVSPSQSLEYYRRLKMNRHPAVRLVQYPGEGHGNRRQTGRIDAIHRILDWYDWYVKDNKPLDGPMPPLDISDKYGLKLKK